MLKCNDCWWQICLCLRLWCKYIIRVWLWVIIFVKHYHETLNCMLARTFCVNSLPLTAPIVLFVVLSWYGVDFKLHLLTNSPCCMSFFCKIIVTYPFHITVQQSCFFLWQFLANYSLVLLDLKTCKAMVFMFLICFKLNHSALFSKFVSSEPNCIYSCLNVSLSKIFVFLKWSS